MKRFYETVEVATRDGGGFAVMLDGREARTPAPLALPTLALAEAVADEWREQGDEIRPDAMPVTRLANKGLATDRAGAVSEVAGYGATDLVCYRAEHPGELASLQHEAWQPMLDWLAARHAVRLAVTTGVLPAEQPEDALDALGRIVNSYDDAGLTALGEMTRGCGSLVIALAVADGHVAPAEAWSLSRIDEDFQISRWGTDEEAAGQVERQRATFLAAARYLELARLAS
jgi:chaperone required for assembly of F1-ATPase